VSLGLNLPVIRELIGPKGAVYGGAAAALSVTNNGSLNASGVGQSGILLVGVSGDAGTVVNNGAISATEGTTTPNQIT
jgi:hypothetical protein